MARVRFRTRLRHWLGPLTVGRAARRARDVLQSLRPDLVHAMRIPFEGMIAASADPSAPLLVSVWGNDFTLHAAAAPGMARRTRRVLTRADGLHVDCRRDERLARGWGFAGDRPVLVAPGNGGVRGEVFHPGAGRDLAPSSPVALLLADGRPLVVNPRGVRAYVRNDTFFRAIPQVRRRIPQAAFLCPAMRGAREAERWVERSGSRAYVHLLPSLSSAEMAAVFAASLTAVSLTEHDGTPNTLLEAMACGCFPVVADLESIREWVEHGVNGLLVDPSDPAAAADALARALTDERLRKQAAVRNAQLVAERASYPKVMREAEELYQRLVDHVRG
jgi:glycosyltransferase involved in cell wall biosynthesis